MGTRYDRGIYRHNQELTQRNEALERELEGTRLLLKEVRISPNAKVCPFHSWR
ncbi:hypothetical protein AGMMS49992_32800 [Clostridia bacterium]|nr:hypothetical protein AGMMS49992_32800 [Clostridia bacterium]